MTENITTPLTGEKFIGIADIYESIGSLIIRWSQIERALKKSINGSQSEGMREIKIHSISQTLNHWKDLHLEMAGEHPGHRDLIDAVHSKLVGALEIRNRICHGSVELKSSMTLDEDNAWIITELNGSERILPLSELKSNIQFLYQTQVRLRDIKGLAKQRNKAELNVDCARLCKLLGLS